MGLDMYAFSARPDAKHDSKDSTKELAYWRKHPNLHGWMEQLYREKGGSEDQFNGVEVELTDEDLNRLEGDILRSGLPDTQGFFFGSDSDDYYRRQDLQFIQDARADILCGLKVYYNSWW